MKWLRWQGRKVPENVVVILIALLIGVVTGTATFLLKRVLALMYKYLEGPVMTGVNYRFLFLPIVGIMLAMIYQRYVLKKDISHGTLLIKQDLVKRQYKMKGNLMYASLLGCASTIGFGGTAGSEGPSAYTGAAIAGNIGRVFNLSKPWMRVLIGCGAGAGIAGIFKSPIGGVLFTLEVLQLEMRTITVVALMISCLFASVTAFAWSGFQYDVSFNAMMPFEMDKLPWILLLGVICGIYSLYYSYTKDKSSRILYSINNKWIRALASGAMLAISIFFFPALYGEGYGLVSEMLNGRFETLYRNSMLINRDSAEWIVMATVAGILLLKGMLVSATNSGGGVAGVFAPTLFAGALLGYLFGWVLQRCGVADISAGNFALLGMAAVMAGTVHAPLMAIFITAEMTNSYTFMFGFIIVAAISYAIVKIATPKSRFTDGASDEILALREERATPRLSSFESPATPRDPI